MRLPMMSTGYDRNISATAKARLLQNSERTTGRPLTSRSMSSQSISEIRTNSDASIDRLWAFVARRARRLGRSRAGSCAESEPADDNLGAECPTVACYDGGQAVQVESCPVSSAQGRSIWSCSTLDDQP